MSQLVHTVRRSPRRARLAAAAVLVALAAFMLVWIGRASADEVGAATTISEAPLATGQDVQPAVSGNNCKLPRTDFTTSIFSFSTSSATFADMPETQDTISQGGQAPSCVVVNFSGHTISPGLAVMAIRAVLDGTVIAEPGQVFLSGDDDEDQDFRTARSHAMNFVFPSVAPGTHTVSIQWRNAGGAGSSSSIAPRTLLVHHK
jgi:hypothetical protein